MIEHVIARLRPQADPVLLSVQDAHSEMEAFELVNVSDIVQRHRGPLTGLCSAMKYLVDRQSHSWLLMSPCDAPFLPPDLASRLFEAAQMEDKPVSVVRYEQVVQPTFSLWNLAVFPQVHDAVMSSGRGGLMSMLDHLPHVSVDWPVEPVPPFFNVNTPADLAMAEQLLDAKRSTD